MSCHELQNLNHSDNQVTYQTKLKSSKYQGMHLLSQLFTTHLNNYV